MDDIFCESLYGSWRSQTWGKIDVQRSWDYDGIDGS